MSLYSRLGLCAVVRRLPGLRFAEMGLRWRAFGMAPLLIGAVLGLADAAINPHALGPRLARRLGERRVPVVSPGSR